MRALFAVSSFPSLRRIGVSVSLWLLAIEFLDEFVFGAREAAWPAIRSDLSLSYTQIGLLLSVPNVVSSFIEPAIGIAGDSRWRARLVFGGAIAFAGALALAAIAPSCVVMMVAFVLLYPASGAFVSLSQANLMDLSPGDHDGAMARWTVAGSVGVVAGPLALAAATFAGFGWRELLLGFGGLALLIGVGANRARPAVAPEHEDAMGFVDAARATLRVARSREVWRWLILLMMSDLMLDVLLGFLALYLVDSGDFSLTEATFAISVWAVVGLVGDGLLVVMLKRMDGLRYLRVSAVVTGVLFVAFLMVPGFAPKVAVLGAMGLLNAGWYAIPKARLYASLPGQSGAAMSLGSAFGLANATLPAGLGLVASTWSIDAAMWLLLAGPVALLVGLPRRAEPAKCLVLGS